MFISQKCGLIGSVFQTETRVCFLYVGGCSFGVFRQQFTQISSESDQSSFQPVIHKGRGVCYPVCGMMHIKEPLLLIRKSSPCGGSLFPLSLSEWSFTICPTPYNRR